jgi:hypothetical protein
MRSLFGDQEISEVAPILVEVEPTADGDEPVFLMLGSDNRAHLPELTLTLAFRLYDLSHFVVQASLCLLVGKTLSVGTAALLYFAAAAARTPIIPA